MALTVVGLGVRPCAGQMGLIPADRPRLPLSPRGDLPFAIQPERLPGPPRAEGELPEGATQPPSTLPGRFPGPPRAEGMAPTPPLRPFEPLLEVEPPRVIGPLPGIEEEPAPPIQPRPEPLFIGEALPVGPILLPLRPLPPDREVAIPLPEIPETEYLTSTEPPLLPMPPRPEEIELRGPPLTLEEVVASALRSYPPYRAFLEERNIAVGDLLSAIGGFDLSLMADGRNWPLGYYRRYLYDVFVEQPTMLWGAKFFAGWRLGVGDWPIYYQYLESRGGGAYVTGLDFPILRGGPIDLRRAQLWQAEVTRRRVEPMILEQRINLIRDVTRTYWAWFTAGHAYLVYDSLLRVAEIRERAVARQVDLGAVAPIELTEMQRVVLQRQALLVTAKRKYQQTAIALSLYYRDPFGQPILPETNRLPTEFPLLMPPEIRRLPEDAEIALRLRPELQSLRLQYQGARINRDFAQNQFLPRLNLYMYGEQNVGSPVPLRNKQPYIMESSLLFEVPIQRRFARGQIRSAEAAMRQVRAQEHYTRDRIFADVQNAMSELQATYERVFRYRWAVDLNRTLQEAEQRRFELGLSTVLFTTLREQMTADAAVQEIDAVLEYLYAVADYRAAMGIDAYAPDQLPD